MAYKYTADYAYKKLVGDYRYRGDPGIFSFIGKALGTIGKTVIGGLPGPVGAIARGVGKFVARRPKTAIAVGAGATYAAGRGIEELMEGEAPRRRRMNVTNVRALRRAIRRAKGFAKLARRTMTWPIQKPPKGRGLFKKRAR